MHCWSSLLLRLGGIALCVAFGSSKSPLQAAAISVGDGKPCGITLAGEIVEGDAARLNAALNESGASTLCLDSTGGSFAEALAMVKGILESPSIETYIGDGALCYSACALVFLAGAERFHDIIPTRTMHVRAKLGLHAPYGESVNIKTETGALNFFKAGIVAVTGLMETLNQELFPDSMRIEMLRHLGGEKDQFEIDTVDEVGRWHINLAGYQPQKTLTVQDAERGCDNQTSWKDDQSATDDIELEDVEAGDVAPSRPSDKTQRGIRRMVFEREGPVGDVDCVVTSAQRDGRLFIDITIGNASEVQTGAPGITPTWYLLPPATKLASISLGPGSDMDDRKQAEEGLQ